jgi:hypothetical protein
MRQRVSQALYAYWNEVRGERLAPRRLDIEPGRISALLPDTFILERIDGRTSRFRVAGTRICEAFGGEFRGLNLFDLVGDEDRITLQRQIAVIASQGAAGVFLLSAETTDGATERIEMLLLPLTHGRDVVDRFVGSMAIIDRPDWIGATPLGGLRILAHELIWPDGRPHAMIDSMGRRSPFMSRAREARIVRTDRRQFRVYDGGLTNADD